MSDPEIKVVTVGSVLESTPEGQHHMDNLQREYDARRAAMSPAVRDIVDAINERIEGEMFAEMFGSKP